MRVRVLLLCCLAIAGCASRPGPVAEVTPPPVQPTLPQPQFATAGIIAPPLLADGSYATPNRSVSPAAAIWHLRAGLNVAALGCRGASDYALAGQYNALLAGHRDELAWAQRTLAAELGGAAGYDDAMTRLYNYFAMPPAQPRFCAEAGAILAAAASVPAGGLAGFAQGALPLLDQPFVQVFAAVDATRGVRLASAPASGFAGPVAMPSLAVDAGVLVRR